VRRNRFIRAPEVRCIDENGNQIGILATRDAQQMAMKKGLDLVEVSPTADPPVCRIMDFGKYKYEQEKKERMARKNQTMVRVKEVKFHVNVGDHDYQTKVRHACEFLQEGHRVKLSLYFRGRENAHQDMGFAVLNRVAADCEAFGVIEQTPKFIGRNLVMMISARKQRETPK
jgi:translation initiation factor IF-3